jgi:hypothetical protein
VELFEFSAAKSGDMFIGCAQPDKSATKKLIKMIFFILILKG